MNQVQRLGRGEMRSKMYIDPSFRLAQTSRRPPQLGGGLHRQAPLGAQIFAVPTGAFPLPVFRISPALLLAATAIPTAILPASTLGADWQGANNNWADSQNWDPQAVPGPSDPAVFGLTFITDIYSNSVQSVGEILFTADAPEYVIHLNEDFSVGGDITSESGATQFFYIIEDFTLTGGRIDGLIEFHTSFPVKFIGADAGTLFLNNSGTADFQSGSTAGVATINNSGALRFWDTSDAGTAVIQNTSGGVTEFYDSSSAGDALLVNDGFGATFQFYDDSSAGTAEINNMSGFVIFYGDATAGDAVIYNDSGSNAARTVIFQGDSTAGNATLSTYGDFASINFYEFSNAGTATITAGSGVSAPFIGEGEVVFQENSSAQQATLIAESDGTINFRMDSSGGDARAIVNVGGLLRIDELFGTGTTLGSIEGAGTINLGDKQLIVGSNGLSTEFSGIIEGVGGSLAKTGTGTLTLSGINTYTGATTVGGGKLVVNGSIAASSGVTLAGGTLGGSGIIGAVNVAAGGAVAPGNSIGTINVASVTFDPGSFYDVEVDAAGNTDLILATGAATLSGGIVRVLPAAGTFGPSTSYTILTAASVTGAFDGVTSSLAFLTPVLSYDATNVFLTLDRNSVAFPGVGLTPNQRSAATGAEALGSGSRIYDAILGLSATEAQAAFDALSGEAHAALKGVFLDDDHLRRAALRRVNQAEGIWANAYGARGTIQSDGNAAALDHAAGGLIAGADVAFGDWRLGLLANAGRTGFSIPGRASSGDSTDYGLGLYGGANLGDTSLAFGAAYIRHDIAATRTAAFPGFADALSASYAAGTSQLFAELSHELNLGELSLSPFTNLAYVSHATDGFTEQGGGAALTSAADVLSATFTTLGLRAEQQFAVGDDVQLTALSALGWRHTFADLPTAGNAFTGGAAFTVAGAPLANDALVLEAGLMLDLSGGANLDLYYDGQLGPASQSHAFKSTLSGQF